MKINGNLTFLGGGVLENMRLDGLAADPGLPMEQQMWLNTTEKKIKAQVDGVTITLADNINVTNITNEVNEIESAIGLDADGKFVAFTGTNYLNSATSVTTSLTALDTQAKANADAVAAEATRATGAESGIQAELDASQLAIGLEADGTLAAFNGTNYILASTTVRNAVIALDTQAKANADAVAAEATRAAGVESGLATRLTSVEGSYINKDGSVAFTGDANLNANKITNLANPVADSDGVNFGTLKSSIAALGNAFAYVGVLEGGVDAETPTDLSVLEKKIAGSYYKVSVSGWFQLGTDAAFYVNAKDGLIFNTTGGIDIVDNTNSQVQGVTNFVTVTGNTDTGYTVDIAENFKTRLTTAESGITAEVTRATGAETTLQGNIDTVSTNLATEVTRATGAETTLQNNIDAEVTRATGIEAALQTEVDAVENSVGLNADGTFTALTGTNYLNSATTIVGLSQALDTAVKALSTKMSDSFFVYNGTTPALSHTVTHNFNNKYANVTVVDVDDKVILPQSITYDSANALTVTFNSSIACKVVVSGLKVVA